MARRRFQDPKPEREGAWWYLRFWKDHFNEERRVWERKRVREKLGPATMLEREARREAVERLRPANQNLVTAGAAVSFGYFVDTKYEKAVLPNLAATTAARDRSVIRHYLKPAFGKTALRDLTKLLLDQFFATARSWKAVKQAKKGKPGEMPAPVLTRPVAHKTIHKVREVLSRVLAAAVEYDFLVKNPARNVRIPRPTEGKKQKPWITYEVFQKLVELISEPYATMVYVAVYTGLRAGEIIALRWRNVGENTIYVEQRCSRGENGKQDWSAPKSAASNTTIPVNRAVIERINRLKQIQVPVKCGKSVRYFPAVKFGGSDDLVFQGAIKGGPLRDDHILRRHIKPAGRKLGIPWVNWLVLRRSFGTWLAAANVNIKDAQALMRHSRAELTLDVYQQFIPESQRRAVETKLPGVGLVQ